MKKHCTFTLFSLLKLLHTRAFFSLVQNLVCVCVFDISIWLLANALNYTVDINLVSPFLYISLFWCSLTNVTCNWQCFWHHSGVCVCVYILITLRLVWIFGSAYLWIWHLHIFIILFLSYSFTSVTKVSDLISPILVDNVHDIYRTRTLL